MMIRHLALLAQSVTSARLDLDMVRRWSALVSLVLLLAVLAACSGGTQPIALVASAPASLAVGNQRVLLGIVDPDTQAFLADPEIEASATFTSPSGDEKEVGLEFVWAIPDQRGLYRVDVDLPEAGNWTVSVAAEGFSPTEPVPLTVVEDTPMPQVGEKGPAVATRTADEFELSEITTDPEPDPELYRLSLDEALTDDRPTVVVFATPAFCTSQTCGPVLDNVKELAPAYPDVDFIHVEVYENLDAQSFEELIPVEAVNAWGLPSEPWVFVTDADGVITARYEGTLDPVELEESLGALTS